MLQANSFALLEELRIDHSGRLQLLLVVVGMIFVVGTYSREEFSSGCEFNVPSRASALNFYTQAPAASLPSSIRDGASWLSKNGLRRKPPTRRFPAKVVAINVA
jgi:hypothetical protein